MKEYVVDLSGTSLKRLKLIFSPWNHSIAFINGIEVVSMPSKLFPSSAVPVLLGLVVEIPPHVAFETAYRANMGGPLVSPKNDSVWRIWIPDKPFLINVAVARSVASNARFIKHPDGESFKIAPNWL